MRRAVVTTAATAAGIVMLLSLKPHGTELGFTASGGDSGSSGTGSAPSPSTGSSSGSSSAGSSGSGSGSSATRTVTGDAVDTRWGPVQLKLTLQGKKITKIDVLQYPQNNRKDEEINSYALPVLTQEALSAQSANIQAVSGATVTSGGYIQSLQSALDKS